MSALRRLRGGAVLVAMFVYDIVAASIAVARIVLAPTRRNSPAVVAVPLDARTEWGIALFAYLVSLTPGSTAIHVADDRRTLYVHFLDAPDTTATGAKMKALYERHIIDLEGTERKQR